MQTGLVSPQYHVVFDDEFTTVKYLDSTTPPPNWEDLVDKQRELCTDFGNDRLNERWLYPSSHPTAAPTISTTAPASEGAPLEPTGQTIITPSEGVDHNSSAVPDTSSDARVCHGDMPKTFDPATASPSGQTVLQIPRGEGEETTQAIPFQNLDTLGLRRSPRIQALSRKPIYTFLTMASLHLLTTTSAVCSAATACYQTRKANYTAFLEQNFDGTSNTHSPLAQIFFSSQANNEVYTLKEMLLQPDKEQFFKAMEDEVQSMFDQEIWKIVSRTEMEEHYAEERRKGREIKREQIMMIWSFKRKRSPDGTLTKHKARLCCHGGQQQWGLNYWDTYAPVVLWSSIRILMTLSKLHGMHTKSIDFVQAYPQANIKSSIFLKSPQGIELCEGTYSTYVVFYVRGVVDNHCGSRGSVRIYERHILSVVILFLEHI